MTTNLPPASKLILSLSPLSPSPLPPQKEQQKKALDNKQQELFKKKNESELAARSKPGFFSTGIQLGKSSNLFQPLPKDESKPYVYKPRDLQLNGPKLPTIKELVSKGYLNNVRGVDEQDRAGGFEHYYSCCRALMDAYCGLYFNNKQQTGQSGEQSA